MNLLSPTELPRAISVIAVLGVAVYSAGAGNCWGALYCGAVAGWCARDVWADVLARRAVEKFIATTKHPVYKSGMN